MSADTRRAAQMKRQLRVLAIEKTLAIRKLAEAQAEHDRMAALASRSRALQAGYAGRSTLTSAQQLREANAFSGALGRISEEAEAMSARTEAITRRAVEALARLDTRLEKTEERMREAEKRDDRRVQARAAAMSGNLAQRLQSRS